MECKSCGSLVLWRGPLSNLTHTECEGCGAMNNQVNEESSDTELDKGVETTLRDSLKVILGEEYQENFHVCRLAGMAEARMDRIRSVIRDISRVGCSGGVCANSVDVAREMRDIARLAIESYGRLPNARDQRGRCPRRIQVSNENVAASAPVHQLVGRIREYLTNGGLFNPEAMDHEKVRDLLMDVLQHLAKEDNTNKE
jgi:hypothetical protein